jgi:hypothetical protein
MTHFLFTALASAVAAQGASAPAEDNVVDTGPIPAWVVVSDPLPVPETARGPVFMRRQIVEIHLDQNGQRSFSSVLMRLLDANALPAGNISIAWNPAAGKPIVHALKVYRNGVARDVLATTKFTILRREDRLEAAMLDGMLTATLKVPDLRVGDDLELVYSVPTQDPTLRDRNAGFLILAPTPPPGRYALRLSWDKGQEPTVRPTADMAGLVVKGERSIAYSADTPPTLNPPKDAPGRYNWQRLIEYSDFADWRSVSARISPLFTKAAAIPSTSPLKQEAAAIAASTVDPMARAQAALKLVQQQVRYVYVGLNGGNLNPASADETWARRYGDCKGKTVLLLALLKELGITAQPVLASNEGNDDGLDGRLPSPLLFDHVLVKAQIGSKSYWLDGTLPSYFRPSESPALPYRWTLPLSQSGEALFNLPWQPQDKPNEISLFEIDAREGFTTPAKIHQTSIIRGVQAIQQYYQFSALSDDQLQSAFRQELEGSESWNSLESVTWRFDPKEQASVLDIKGTGPVDWKPESGGGKSYALPGGGFSPPERRQRGTASDAPFAIKPDFDCKVTSLRLPTGTAAADWTYNSTFTTTIYGQTFRRSFELRDGTLRMMRVNRTLQNEISSETAAKDTLRLAKFDNSMAWAQYRQGVTATTAIVERVPATFERDWLADASACLATTYTKP